MPVAATFDPATKKLTGFPASLKGGLTTISLTQSATAKYSIDLDLVRLDQPKTDAEIIKALSEAPPTWATFFGGTSVAGPGKTRTTTVNLTKGNYIWRISSGDSTLDAANPIGRFSVGAAAAGTLPKGSSTIVTKDYGFEVSGLKAGVNNVSYSNAGKEVHIAVMTKLMPGKTLADAQKAFGADGPPPAGVFDEGATNFASVLPPGGKQTMDLELTKGTYVFVCFISDKNGKPHFMSGMIKEVPIA
jgi:hypothetical protein